MITIKAPETATHETMYGIFLPAPINQWAGARRQWVDSPAEALRFHSMTAATIAALDVLQLGPADFTVEAI